MSHQSRKTGNRFENKVRKSVGSGNVWFSPLDIHDGTHCIEAKYTDQKGYRITTDLLEKIWAKALNVNKEPFLIVGLRRNDKEIFTVQCHINVEKDGKKC